MQLADILAPIAQDMGGVDRLIRARLRSDVVLINTLADHIINSGGKRLRPALALLAARAGGYRGEAHLLLAAIIEFIHTATLLHDDVVDVSAKRRGQDTANALWGNSASVLTGDFLYSRAFQMMVELDHMPVMRTLAETTNRISEGEVMQLMNAHDPDLDEAAYLEVIDRKTASLFAAGCGLGVGLAGADNNTQAALEAYGRHLGIAFQLIDDALDYDADAGQLGKNIGDDLAEGKATLPLIRALSLSPPEQAKHMRDAIVSGESSQLATIQEAIETTQAMAYTFARAEDEASAATAALQGIPDSPHRRALLQLAEFAVTRRF